VFGPVIDPLLTLAEVQRRTQRFGTTILMLAVVSLPNFVTVTASLRLSLEPLASADPLTVQFGAADAAVAETAVIANSARNESTPTFIFDIDISLRFDWREAAGFDADRSRRPDRVRLHSKP
jgi:hypothetical protein